jgi:hypothetical protein
MDSMVGADADQTAILATDIAAARRTAHHIGGGEVHRAAQAQSATAAAVVRAATCRAN